MNRKHQIFFNLILVLVSLVLFAPEADSFYSFNEVPDCLECHGNYAPAFNCNSCHTIFSGGPTSAGHAAHLGIKPQLSCSMCHINAGDDPLMSKCNTCHLWKGLTKHHNSVGPPAGTGLCWMCHNEDTPEPENTIPPGYAGTCIDTCDGSEELFNSLTVSLDNDGDLLIDSFDPDCFICTPIARTVTFPNDFVTLQAAFDDAVNNETIKTTNKSFIEDLYIDLPKTVNLQSGYDCSFASNAGNTTLEGVLTLGPGVLVLKSGTLVIKTPEEVCDDTLDNDGDLLIDCADPDCENDPACSPATEVLCNDCVDNDNDTFIDCADSDCSGDPACPVASCTDCHGGSGTTGAPLINSDLVSPVTGHTEGAHPKHVTDQGIVNCAVCHNNNGMPTTDQVITIAFSGTATANSSSPSYDGTTLNVPYSYNPGVLTTTGTQDCSNVYCHSSVQGAGGTGAPGSYATPDWDALGVTCDSCHGLALEADGQPANGSHNKHAAGAEQNYACSTCHNGAGSGTTLHANNTINLDIDNTYGTSAAYSQGDHTPGVGGYGTCSNVYCHSDGLDTYATPQWGATSTGCNFCHADLPVTGAHSAHVQTAATAYGSTSVDTTGGTYNFGCGNCHPYAADEVTKHRDGNVDITMNSGHGGTLKSLNNVADDVSGYAQTQGTAVTCSAAYCHSQGDGTFVASPEWYAGSVGTSCDACHGNSPSTNAHSVHVVGIHYYNIYSGTTGLATAGTGGGDSHGSATYSTTINCNTCHNSTVNASANDQNTVCATCHAASPQGNMAIAALTTTHLNGTADVALNAISVKSKAQLRDDITTVAELNENWTRDAAGYKASGAYDQAKSALSTATMYDSTSNTCSTVACHNGNSAAWGDTGVSCTYCHSDVASTK